MANGSRDDFTERVRNQIGKRAGWLCSAPFCRRHTDGSNLAGDGEFSVGVAAHICAAAPNGPRYDASMKPEQRRSADNGIWLCQDHARAIDSDPAAFTVECLRAWKSQAQQSSFRRVLVGQAPRTLAAPRPSESELSAFLQAAAVADLDLFRSSERWPSTGIELTLEVVGLPEPISTSGLAAAIPTLDDMILVAPPGMGKTTALFQIAEGMVERERGVPIIVPLGDWSADGASLVGSVLRRAAFHDLSEDCFHAVAAHPGVVLLLDGWNELDSDARRRAVAEVSRLHLELPQVSLVISTRKQALDVPINGAVATLQPLSSAAQVEIARALQGEQGTQLVERAWHTEGLRQLVTVPLYLTTLLELPEGTPFPTTKEELLRYFVAIHEQDFARAEALGRVMQGMHQRYLVDLACAATRAATTTLAERSARSSVSSTGRDLVAEGQIVQQAEPHALLERLVSHHVLVRTGDSPGYSFQHQQFQEWFASHFVERLMLTRGRDAASLDQLRSEVLNQRMWEEAILFACERLARGKDEHQEACSSAILVAFDVDPMLAAEMIFRATDPVWTRVAPRILGVVGRWHEAGKVDRAFRFMVLSGREEFRDKVWPLISHEDDQVHLAALRTTSPFRTSVLGRGPGRRLAGLAPGLRSTVLREIVFDGGMDSCDLATSVALADPDPGIVASVAEALAFRHARRHVNELLQVADDEVYDQLRNKELVEEVGNECVRARIDVARDRNRPPGVRTYQQISALVYGPDTDERIAELTSAIAEMEVDPRGSGATHLIYEAKERFPRAVAEGVLQRVRDGSELPSESEELLFGAQFSLEDEDLLDIAMSLDPHDYRADAAASVLGPHSTGRLVDVFLDLHRQIRNDPGHEKELGDRLRAIQDRIDSAQTASLLAAISERSQGADHQAMVAMAELISRHPSGKTGRGQPFDSTTRDAIAELAQDWGERLLSLQEATRNDLASIATLASCSGAPCVLPILTRLLDEELSRWRSYRERARAEGYRRGRALNEMRMSWTLQYQSAFLATNSPDTAAVMRKYLLDEDFGRSAALVLAGQWSAANEPIHEDMWRSSPDLSRIAESRERRVSEPDFSSEAADDIFCAVEHLLDSGTTEERARHAVRLAIVAAALPHGQRAELLDALTAMAERSRRSPLLTNLVLSGEVIDVGHVKRGIAELLALEGADLWILREGYELKTWLRLLPFTDRPSEALGIVQELPEQYCTRDPMAELVRAFGFAPGEDADTALFQLAEGVLELCANRTWCDAFRRRGTLSAAERLVDLIVRGTLQPSRKFDHRQMSEFVANLIDDHPGLRRHVYRLLTERPHSPATAVLARAVSENPDDDGFLLLLKLELEHGNSYITWQTTARVLTKRVPIPDSLHSYNVVPVPAVELRRELLVLTTDTVLGSAAARYLTKFDEIRDECGAPESEPRHPDLASGLPWPLLA